MKIKYGILAVGGAGGVLANNFERKYGRTVIYVNSSDDDYSFVAEPFIKMTGLNGLSKNRSKANELWDSLQGFKSSLVESVERNFIEKDYKVVYITTSSSGGTGSGFTSLIYEYLSKEFPKVKFIIAATLPQYEKSDSFINTMKFIEEIRSIKANYILYRPTKMDDVNLIHTIGDNYFSYMIHNFMRNRKVLNGDLDISERMKLLTGHITMNLKQYHIMNENLLNEISTVKCTRTNRTEYGLIRDMNISKDERKSVNHDGYYHAEIADNSFKEKLIIGNHMGTNDIISDLQNETLQILSEEVTKDSFEEKPIEIDWDKFDYSNIKIKTTDELLSE